MFFFKSVPPGTFHHPGREDFHASIPGIYVFLMLQRFNWKTVNNLKCRTAYSFHEWGLKKRRNNRRKDLPFEAFESILWILKHDKVIQMIVSTTFKRFYLIHISQADKQSNWWDVDQARDWWKRNQGEPFPPYSSIKADCFTNDLSAYSIFPFSETRGHLISLSIFIQIGRWKEGSSSHLVKEY